jgi:serine/threonine-protein kinase
MAEVFLAVHHGLEDFQKVVVLKRVLRQHGDNADFVQMFVDEARLAARLEHPNIVRTYEFGAVDGVYFTAMEYLPGEDLAKTLTKLVYSRQRMPLNIACGIVANICSGLQFAHQLTDTGGRPLNLIHRDINPANIIVTYTGEVKLIDFGVAKTNATETVTGTIKGKVAYMSPEQLLARGIDQRSDVFSTGVVLWESLVGQPLFLRDTEAATLYAIMNDPIRPPSRFRADVPRALDDIVMRALARTPADRFDSAEELGGALERVMESLPKYDGRVLARMVESLFGSTRADAKRSIAQTRSLRQNISLVMKVRTDVIAKGSGHGSPAIVAPEPRRSRVPMYALGLLMLACIAGGILYVVYGSRLAGDESEAPAAIVTHASLEISSTPPGASIALDGEPTGLRTPSTITGITKPRVTVQLVLAGHAAISQSIDVPTGAVVSKKLALVPLTGRLVLERLPAEASVFVDGDEFMAGEVIDVLPGLHMVRIVVRDKTIVEQQLETRDGDQLWRLTDNRLVPSN